MRYVIAFALFVALGSNAQASVLIAATDFNGRTVSGSTASNLTWVVNGVADPGDLTASAGDGLFDTANAQNLFAVDRNLHNEGSWSVDVPLNVGASSLQLSSVSLDAYIFNNAGSFQPAQRDLDLTVDLILGGVLDSVTVNNVYASNGSISQPQHVTFDLTGNTLTANTNYVLRLTAFGTGPGNNAGIDNFALYAIPEPTSVIVWSLLVVGAIGRNRS